MVVGTMSLISVVLDQGGNECPKCCGNKNCADSMKSCCQKKPAEEPAKSPCCCAGGRGKCGPTAPKKGTGAGANAGTQGLSAVPLQDVSVNSLADPNARVVDEADDEAGAPSNKLVVHEP
jgi:hypothetical protein